MALNRRVFGAGLLAVWASPVALAIDMRTFKPVSTQFLAALADPSASKGAGAENWGLWTVDPGPRGVRLSAFDQLKGNGNVAPAGWTYDPSHWWLEEHGLIMEQPAIDIAAGRYVVTGDRTVETVLTIFPKDASGSQRWDLADGATLYDVTHLRCRAARYEKTAGSSACTPGMVQQSSFPVPPGDKMPLVKGCDTQDFAVLFIVGIEE